MIMDSSNSFHGQETELGEVKTLPLLSAIGTS